MSGPPIVTVTDLEVTVHSQRFPELHTKAWDALLDWCEFHDINPELVPMLSTITRNPAACRVEYDQLVVDEQGLKVLDPNGEPQFRRVHSQGETPPMPWPAELLQVVGR